MCACLCVCAPPDDDDGDAFSFVRRVCVCASAALGALPCSPFSRVATPRTSCVCYLVPLSPVADFRNKRQKKRAAAAGGRFSTFCSTLRRPSQACQRAPIRDFLCTRALSLSLESRVRTLRREKGRALCVCRPTTTRHRRWPPPPRQTQRHTSKRLPTPFHQAQH